MPFTLFRRFKQHDKRSQDAGRSVEHLILAAETAARQGNTSQALELYSKVIGVAPEHAEAHYKAGNLLRISNRMDEALSSYDRAIAVRPGFANAFCNRGVVLERLGRLVEASQSYARGIELNPDDSVAHYNHGSVLNALGRPDEALASYNEAIRIKPDHAESYCNRGLLLAELGDSDAALASYDVALKIRPSLAQAHFNRASLLQARKQLTEALASYDRAIAADPGYADAYCNRGLILMESRNFQEALASFAQAIHLRPDHAEAYCNRGLVFAELGRAESAIRELSTAISLKPNYAEAYYGRGTSLLNQKDFQGAIADYAKTLELKPDFRFMLGMYLHVKMSVCDWTGLDSDLSRIADGIEKGETLSPPFPLLALLDTAPLHHKAAQIWAREECPASTLLPPLDRNSRTDKIRIGYFSADFRDHAVAVLMAGLFESHDRAKFEVIAFAFGPDTRDAMRERLEKAFDRFVDVREKSDQETAMLARSLSIDIAVDLGGYTGHTRTKIFSYRAAPIQISYIGYLGTMGAPYMDYLIADPTIVPAGERHNYSEKIIYLPSYQVNDSRRLIGQRSFSREELGIPAAGFVFCCFNSNYKIMPATFAVWMRILQRVRGSVLFLYADNPVARQNLYHEAQRCGIDSHRIIFGVRLATQDYLARYRRMDLFLDTLPYNAGTTASDALWAGLPVLTCAGRAFAGRVAASLLSAVDMPELITSNPQQYEDLAVRLAENPDEMAWIREKLARNRHATLLFDTASFTRSLESAYLNIHERNQRGLPPDHVFVTQALA